MFTAAFITTLPVSNSAQSFVNGLYKTENDFVENRLTDRESTNEQNRIQAYRGVLKVYRKGKSTVYKSGSVYGYQQDGVTYRAIPGRSWFSENGYCKVVSNGAFVIYSKQSTHHRSNGRVWYYYSIGINGKIRRLTKQSLTKDFTHQPEFLSAAQAKLDKHDLKEALAISELYAKFN
ncbi:MAG TPA: hypothetical protein PKL56_05610 [Cyclobacteriaceae bacterium]|nr:hypothetical protein [Cyclobacteriaceae bacterium]HMV89181.1 hypothetical protein [Cyclobacteriaceae bacterium]HMX01243.1 hypothetical protein [Cyclobacteriaceae bacterium]HMX50646.1 hypothetical protein [Cyclobacteriaceae bacterium]HMY92045.1 hypothetical protein [Cyclobacteriaceae bacterium]